LHILRRLLTGGKEKVFSRGKCARIAPVDDHVFFKMNLLAFFSNFVI
jgi:hypothetical protein